MHCTEAEYVTIVEAGKKTIWMTDYLEEWARSSTKIFFTEIVRVSYSWRRNPVYHLKRKHRRRYHFTCRLVKDGDVFREDRGCKESSKHVDKKC